jgi:flagellin
MTQLVLQIGAEQSDKITVAVTALDAQGLSVKNLKVDSVSNANAAIQTIKTAINKVSTQRADLGAIQNRLEYTVNNLDTTAENMTAANSRIRDTDMAKEMMNYTKMNVLTQAAQAMLAQANQQPQSVLQLLQ